MTITELALLQLKASSSLANPQSIHVEPLPASEAEKLREAITTQGSTQSIV